MAHPGANANFIKILEIGNFIDAISDPEMRLTIQQSISKVFNEAVKVAVALGSFNKTERQRQGNKYVRGTPCTSVVALFSTETAAILKQLDKLLALNEKIARKTPNAAIEDSQSKSMCYKCKEIGHIQRNCPQKYNDSIAGTVSETITDSHAFVNRVGRAFERKLSRKKENQHRQVSKRVVKAGLN